jgi:hypothetical protein
MPRKIFSTPSGRTLAAEGLGVYQYAVRKIIFLWQKPARRGNYPLLRTYSGTDDFHPLG